MSVNEPQKQNEVQSQENAQNSEPAAAQLLELSLPGTRYAHSGEFNLVSWISVLAIGLIPLFLTAVVYELAAHYIPLVIISGLFTVGFGWIIGYSCGKAGRIMHVRNTFAVAFSAIIMSGFGIYFVWMARLAVFSEGAVISANPLAIWYLMQALIAEYTIELGKGGSSGIPIAGNAHIVIWLIEAAIILFFSATNAKGTINSGGYCESCQGWTGAAWNSPLLIAASPITASELKKQAEEGVVHLNVFEVLSEEIELGVYYVISVQSCSCGELSLLTISEVSFTEEKGKIKQDAKDILENFALKSSSLKALKASSESAA